MSHYSQNDLVMSVSLKYSHRSPVSLRRTNSVHPRLCKVSKVCPTSVPPLSGLFSHQVSHPLPQLCGSCSSPTPITGPSICYFPSRTPYPPFHLITQTISSSSFTFQLNHQFLEKSCWSERNSSPSCRHFQSIWISPSSHISQLHLEMCVIDTSAHPPPAKGLYST